VQRIQFNPILARAWEVDFQACALSPENTFEWPQRLRLLSAPVTSLALHQVQDVRGSLTSSFTSFSRLQKETVAILRDLRGEWDAGEGAARTRLCEKLQATQTAKRRSERVLLKLTVRSTNHVVARLL
jgi:hypothetical protein